jgi:hypothetical protein
MILAFNRRFHREEAMRISEITGDAIRSEGAPRCGRHAMPPLAKWVTN